jgi:hypothetical protein
MQRQLAAVPIARRRRAVLVLTTLATLLIATGVLPWTRPAPASVRVIAVAALLSGLLTLLIAWGLATSLRRDAELTSEAELDAVLAAAGGGCDCGHDHGGAGHADHADPATTPDTAPGAAVSECASGTPDCAHNCAACVLARPASR